MPTVLCISDDAYLSDLLIYALARTGFQSRVAPSGSAALTLLTSTSIDVIVLDVAALDDEDFVLLGRIRAITSAPVLILSSSAPEEQIVRAFTLGAADYMTKPFSMAVLLAHLRALLRHAERGAGQTAPGHADPHGSAPALVHLEGCLFDTVHHDLIAGAVHVRLTAMESALLRVLCTHVDIPQSAERLLELVKGYETESNANVIKTHIRHLRQKIARLPTRPTLIRTLPGVGYFVERPTLTPPDA